MNLLKVFKPKPVTAPPVMQAARLYTNCSELVLHNFDQVLTYNRFEYLKVDRSLPVTDAELQAAWFEIMSEFIPLSKNVSAMSTIKKRSNLLVMAKLLQVYEAVKINIQCDNDVTDVCRRYRLKPSAIDQHIGLLKNDILKTQNKLPKPTDGEPKPDLIVSDIDKSIAVAAKHGYKINRFETVVSEWCQIMDMIENSNPNT